MSLITYELKTLDGKHVCNFALAPEYHKVNKQGKICEQDIINHIIGLNYNPLLYTWDVISTE